MIRHASLFPAVLAVLALLGGPIDVVSGGLVLESSSSITTTYSVASLNRDTTGMNAPQFDSDGVLIYPGATDSHVSGVFPSLGSATVQQPTAGGSPATGARSYTLTSNTDPLVINSTTVGTGKASTSVGSTVTGNGAVSGSAGISFNRGSFVSSSTGSDPNAALVSVTQSFAQFLVTGAGYSSTTPSVTLDVAGYVRGRTGSYVAVGLTGDISVAMPGQEGLPPVSFQLVGAYGGPGKQVTPSGGSFNTLSPPAGYQFEATGNVILPSFGLIQAGMEITINATLTLIADPDSQIILFPGLGIPGAAPDLGIFAGGPVSFDDSIATPEPSTLIGLLTAATITVGLLRRRRTA